MDFPTLLSNAELDALIAQRTVGDHSPHDCWDNAGIKKKTARTDGLPESTIEQRFSHVAKQLVAMWPLEACAMYISRLVVSDRNSREGFPEDVIEDLLMLDSINQMRLQARRG
jgi:hypothetical protein